MIYSGATVLGTHHHRQKALSSVVVAGDPGPAPGSFVTQARTQVEVFTDGAGI